MATLEVPLHLLEGIPDEEITDPGPREYDEQEVMILLTRASNLITEACQVVCRVQQLTGRFSDPTYTTAGHAFLTVAGSIKDLKDVFGTPSPVPVDLHQ